jgi:thiol-disulfide isomerase/thioredoxin
MKHKITFLICLIIILYGCNAPESEIPETLVGNYYDISGDDFWVYSFHKKFIIFNSQFWNVTKVVNRNGFTKIFIKNENSKKRLLITQISKCDFMIEDNKHSKTYSTIANPNLRKAKISPFALHPGKVKIYGFIKNSTKYIESNPRIHFLYHDYLTVETYSVYAPIDSLGRFQLEMELLSAQDIMYQFDNELYSAFVSPNDTLMIYFDPEHPENTDFQGKNSDINYDLLNTLERRLEIASPKEDNNQLSKHFDEYKAYKDSVCKREMRFLNEYSKNEYCSEIFKIWYKTNSEISFYTDLLNYSWKNYYSKDVENSMEAFNAYLDTFFEKINMTDSIGPITGKYFFYTNAVNNKIPRYRKSLLDLINSEIPIEERKEKFIGVYIAKMAVIIDSMEEGRLKDILFAKLVSGEIRNRHIGNIDKTFDLVDERIQYKPYLMHLSDFLEDFKTKEAEFESNPIIYWKSNSKGEQLLKKIIEDNNNKVIILDFWFTGCGACRQDFEKMGTFKKDLSVEADAEFIYLCYSSTEKDWKYVTKEYNLQGQNYLLTQEQIMYFQELFSISSAPRYILINKAGRVVNSNFRPPMNKDQYILEIKRAT